MLSIIQQVPHIKNGKIYSLGIFKGAKGSGLEQGEPSGELQGVAGGSPSSSFDGAASESTFELATGSLAMIPRSFNTFARLNVVLNVLVALSRPCGLFRQLEAAVPEVLT